MNDLWRALDAGDAQGVERAVSAGADLNARASNTGETVLHYAARNYRAGPEAVRWLLDHGFAPDVEADGGHTPLNCAAVSGNVEIVRVLLAAGARADHATRGGWTPMQSALSQGHVNVIPLLAAACRWDERHPGDLGPDLVVAASSYNDASLAYVKAMLDRGVSPDARDGSGRPAVRAACSGSPKSLALLLERGAKPDAADARGDTPLYCAARDGARDLVELLLKHGAAPDKLTGDGQSPLTAALSRGHERIALCLLGAGAKPFAGRTDGKNALELAIAGGHVKAVTRITGESPARVPGQLPEVVLAELIAAARADDVARFERTLELHTDLPQPLLRDAFAQAVLAMRTDPVRALKALLARGFDPNGTLASGLSPLLAAVMSGYLRPPLFRALLDAGATAEARGPRGGVLEILAGADDGYGDGDRPYGYAEGTVDALADVASRAIERGAAVNGSGRAGDDTPLLLAIWNRNARFVRILLDAGADVNGAGRSGFTPLMAAASKGSDALVELLLARGANAAATDREGRTATALALAGGHRPIVERLRADAGTPITQDAVVAAAMAPDPQMLFALLDGGAPVDAVAGDGSTPLAIAARERKHALAHALLDRGANPHVRNRNGWTPLLLTCMYGDRALVERMLTGPCTELDYRETWTPLMAAAMGLQLEIVELLLARGADARWLTPYKSSVLTAACSSSYERTTYTDIVVRLLAAGANPKHADSYGKSVLFFAISKALDASDPLAHRPAIQALIEAGADPAPLAAVVRAKAKPAFVAWFEDLLRLRGR
jgi:ankyrin